MSGDGSRGGRARWAGDPAYQKTKRKFALIYAKDFNDPAILEAELARHGAKLTDKVDYVKFDVAAAQERSASIVTKLKAEGITSVITLVDYQVQPVLTKVATDQEWFPEWILTSAGGQDVDYFARNNDPAQWSHAFGLAATGIGGDAPQPWTMFYQWYWGEPFNPYAYEPFFRGVHRGAQTHRRECARRPLCRSGGGRRGDRRGADLSDVLWQALLPGGRLRNLG